MTIDGIRCVVFDLDDTLYLERDYVRSGFCAVGRVLEQERGVTGFASLAWREFVRGRRGDTFDVVLQQLGLAPDGALVRALVEVYRVHTPSIALEPDALDCLLALHGRFKLALITDGAPASQRAKIASLGLASWMDLLVVTEEQGPEYRKPHPGSFERVQAQLGVPASDCLYAADNPAKDFVAPRQLGWRRYRCRRSLGLHAAVDDAGATDLEGADLAALVNALARG